MASVFSWLSTPALTLRPPGIWPNLRSSTLGEAVQNQSTMMQVSSTWCCFSWNFCKLATVYIVWPFSSFKTRSLSGFHMIFKVPMASLEPASAFIISPILMRRKIGVLRTWWMAQGLALYVDCMSSVVWPLWGTLLTRVDGNLFLTEVFSSNTYQRMPRR